MNAHQTSIQIPTQSDPVAIDIADIPQMAEVGILAAMAIFLVRYLVKSNERLTEKLLEELNDE